MTMAVYADQVDDGGNQGGNSGCFFSAYKIHFINEYTKDINIVCVCIVLYYMDGTMFHIHQYNIAVRSCVRMAFVCTLYTLNIIRVNYNGVDDVFSYFCLYIYNALLLLRVYTYVTCIALLCITYLYMAIVYTSIA